MADTHLRTEGDHEYWETADHQEYKRWAPDNSKGKQAHALASRHPKSGKPINQLPLRKQRQMQSNGGKASYEKRRLAIAESYAVALREIHPDYKTPEDGLLDLARAAIEQGADSEGGGPAVNARAQVYQEYTGGKQEPTVDARQQHVHLTISPGPAAEQKQLMADLMDTIEGEVVDEGQGSEDDEG